MQILVCKVEIVDTLCLQIPYFDDVGVKTLNYLDSLLQWDNLQKSKFYKGLPEALTKLPNRVLLQRVLPCLIRDLAQPTMIPFVLPNILDIAQKCDQKDYLQFILPSLTPVMKLTEPIQVIGAIQDSLFHIIFAYVSDFTDIYSKNGNVTKINTS